ncbi:hypothetical protein BZG36_00084 [Bifiguratus adelaidae]|uniref:PH domain-containing protein n=1 Tax=Bifiguratus adelaidae TaxID=1938954 RepID=A0A261Y8K8_9FUNG|nr:hypothetical protein BZG36_00084 [Bifiguratus adelaidae]
MATVSALRIRSGAVRNSPFLQAQVSAETLAPASVPKKQQRVPSTQEKQAQRVPPKRVDSLVATPLCFTAAPSPFVQAQSIAEPHVALQKLQSVGEDRESRPFRPKQEDILPAAAPSPAAASNRTELRQTPISTGTPTSPIPNMQQKQETQAVAIAPKEEPPFQNQLHSIHCGTSPPTPCVSSLPSTPSLESPPASPQVQSIKLSNASKHVRFDSETEVHEIVPENIIDSDGEIWSDAESAPQEEVSSENNIGIGITLAIQEEEVTPEERNNESKYELDIPTFELLPMNDTFEGLPFEDRITQALAGEEDKESGSDSSDDRSMPRDTSLFFDSVQKPNEDGGAGKTTDSAMSIAELTITESSLGFISNNDNATATANRAPLNVTKTNVSVMSPLISIPEDAPLIPAPPITSSSSMGFEAYLIQNMNRVLNEPKPRPTVSAPVTHTDTLKAISTALTRSKFGQSYTMRESNSVVHACSSPELRRGYKTPQSLLRAGSECQLPPFFEAPPKNYARRKPTPGIVNSGMLYVRIAHLEGFALDLPKDSTSIMCSLSDGRQEVSTACKPLQSKKTIFNEEFKLLTTSSAELTFSINVARNRKSIIFPQSFVISQGHNLLPKFLRHSRSWTKDQWTRDTYHRYLRPGDRILCEAKVSLDQVCEQSDRKIWRAIYPASNTWARPDTVRPFSFRKDEANLRAIDIQIGRLAIDLCWIPYAAGLSYAMPRNLEECGLGLELKEWYATVWQTGYMSQRGGDCKHWRHRYCRLVGGHLLTYHDASGEQRSSIPIASAVKLSRNGVVMYDVTSTGVLGHRPEELGSFSSGSSSSSHSTDMDTVQVKNQFSLTMDNGEELEFGCPSDAERNEWVRIISAFVGRVPACPQWLTLQ